MGVSLRDPIMSKDVHDSSLLEQKENATFRAQRLAAVPSDLLTMHNLLFIDLSYNRITRFPGELVVQDIPRLEVLHLQHNLLYVLEDILALSKAPRLRELNVSANPLRLLDNRIYFLEALFSSASCDIAALRMVHKDPTLISDALSLPAASSGGAPAIYTSKSKPKSKSNSNRTMVLVHKLPRRSGFPMLQKLNGLWIMDDEVRAVELERGRAIGYYSPHNSGHTMCSEEITSDRLIPASNAHAPSAASPERSVPVSTSGRRFDGSRMTAKELIKKSTRSAAIPSATVIQRFRIDVESNSFLDDDDARTGTADLHVEYDGPVTGEDARDVIHRLFERDAPTKKATRTCDEQTNRTSEDDLSGACTSSWNYPIRSFDTLTSDERQYIRHRSKQSVESNLQRDDHFFDSTIYLDCVAQAERSRRLTVRAVDTLCPLGNGSRATLSSSFSTPSLRLNAAPAIVPVSGAAVELRESLASKFSKQSDDKQYERLESFLHKPPPEVASTVGDRDMQAALSELFLSEHVEQRHNVRQLLEAYERDAAAADHPLDVVASQLDDSLSRTKLRNAVDLANALLLNKKQEKRMMQMLIDADTKAIEHERASLEQALHRHRLDLIASNTFYADEQTAHAADREWMAKAAKHTTPSPWQARNWRAKETQRRASALHHRSDRENETLITVAVGSVGGDGHLTAGENQTQGEPHEATSPASRRRGPNRKQVKMSTQARRGKASSVLLPAGSKNRPASAAPASQPPATSAKDASIRDSSMQNTGAAKFRTIETVEQAARDSLDHVDSHDLLVRCAAIRQSTETHTEALAQYRDRFLEDEAAWEAMRQDPINIVRRHLRRKLYQDAQEIQIAGTQLFYSSLFQ